MDVIPDIHKRLDALEAEVFGKTQPEEKESLESPGSAATGTAAGQGTDSTVPKVNPIGVAGGTHEHE